MYRASCDAVCRSISLADISVFWVNNARPYFNRNTMQKGRLSLRVHTCIHCPGTDRPFHKLQTWNRLSGKHRELLRTLEEFLCSLLPLIRRRSAEISEIRGAIHIPASNPREKFDRNRQSSSLNEAEICEIFTQPRQKSLLTDATTALPLSRE